MNLEETLYYEVIKNGITENQILEYEKALKDYPIENVDYFEGLDNKLKLQAERIRIFGKNDFGVIDENDKSTMEKAERNADTVKAYLDYKKAIVSNKTTAPQFSLAENEFFVKNTKNALEELIKKNCIYKLGNQYKITDKSTQKEICDYLVDEYYRKQNKFGGYIAQRDFKDFVLFFFYTMNYAINKSSITKQIENSIKG